MSIDIFILTQDPPAKLTPARIGLGTDAFPWPKADSADGWRYDGARLQLDVRSIDRIVEAFSSFEGIAPGDAKGCIYFAPYWYMDGFEHTVAQAFGGIATTDMELAEGPYMPSEEELADGIEPPPPPTWQKATKEAMRELRAALFADRFRAAGVADLDKRVQAAVGGDADQLALLEKWLARGTARIHGEPDMPRKPDAVAVQTALRDAAGKRLPAAIAKLLATKI